MWQRLVHLMRFDGLKPGRKTPLGKARPLPPANPFVAVRAGPIPAISRMFVHIPRGLKPGAPLVVALHGCGQSAAGYGVEAGWWQLAEEMGFAVLAPEQKAVNNPGTCFNWFNPEDIARGEGEAASIAAMIGNVLETYRLDARRVFITGLSAGGAMTAVMLATYPEVFAGGAVIAGLPLWCRRQCARSPGNHAQCAVAGHRAHGAMRCGRLLPSRAAPFQVLGPEKVSIWHGALDTTVSINNAQASVAQWADLHGVELTDARQEMVEGGGAAELG